MGMRGPWLHGCALDKAQPAEDPASAVLGHATAEATWPSRASPFLVCVRMFASRCWRLSGWAPSPSAEPLPPTQ
eukprot:9327936-Alexandrium_andersonii.AAC.1